ncbi:hypothetical protein [Azonexus sp.]|uniref:hypothetical protein n=1 Tax=Azonexus sp. TaxID=1872668 RepID=UPI0027B88093|nr:hypothetical protein [Azonexus sp.]
MKSLPTVARSPIRIVAIQALSGDYRAIPAYVSVADSIPYGYGLALRIILDLIFQATHHSPCLADPFSIARLWWFVIYLCVGALCSSTIFGGEGNPLPVFLFVTWISIEAGLRNSAVPNPRLRPDGVPMWMSEVIIGFLRRWEWHSC